MELNYKRLQPAQIKVADGENLLRNDVEFFFQFFLGDLITTEIPQFHVDVFHKMTHSDVEFFACAVPRDHAKTTIAKLACVYYFLFTDVRFIVYLSNTAPVAQNACLDIIGFMECANFLQLFGQLEWKIKREGEGFYKFILFPGTDREKVCMLKAQGAGTQVRGLNIDNQRPQLAIVDDLEDTENIATEGLYQKLKKWFYGTFMKALDKFHRKIIQIGNMISNKCLLKEHCESKFWHSMRYGCILSDGTVLWASAFTIDKLRREFQQYLEAGQIHTWFAEMMNMPIAEGMGLIRAEEIRYREPCLPGEPELVFITVDPAISQQRWAHKAAVVVHAFWEDVWQPVDYVADVGQDPKMLFDHIVSLATKWGVSCVGIESIAYQASLQYVFTYMAMKEHIEGLQWIPIGFGQARKAQRLSGWASLVKDNTYNINNGDFLITEQLLFFDAKKKENDDDIIDCCAAGQEMIDFYMPEIMQSISILPIGKVQSSYEIELEHQE